MKDITVGITSLLRWDALKTALLGLKQNFADCEVIVADDSSKTPPIDEYCEADLIEMPYDSGLCAKRNALVLGTQTKYFLLGCDDFVFDIEARTGLREMQDILDKNPDIDVVAGRVNRRDYQGFLEYKPGEFIQEHRLQLYPRKEFYDVDIAVNYFLARTDRLVPWEDELKIGGEHALWFLRMKQAGRRVVWTPYANINTQLDIQRNPLYTQMRLRCYAGHKRMKEILDIKDYIDFNGARS